MGVTCWLCVLAGSCHSPTWVPGLEIPRGVQGCATVGFPGGRAGAGGIIMHLSPVALAETTSPSREPGAA